MGEKRILMISSVPFWPLNEGNKVRTNNLISHLKTCGYIVDFLYYDMYGLSGEDKMKSMIGEEHMIHLVKQEVSPRDYYLEHIVHRVINRPKTAPEFYLLADGFCTKELRECVKTQLRTRKYDMVWLEYYFFSKVFEDIGKDYIKVIDTHDIFAGRDKLFPKKMRKKWSDSLSRLSERKVLRRADYVLAIQETEEKYFKKLLRGTKTKVLTIGNVEAHHRAKSVLVKNLDFCFVGSGNQINIASITWFVEKVYPLIKEALPEARLLLVGKICQEMDDLEEIVKLGQVENLEEIYHKVRVIINPTLMGTGLNIKASEAVFYQKPMVTTSCGARGFCNQEPIFEVADAPEEFAGKVIDLLVNDRKCELLMENCRRYNEKYERENMERLRSIGNDITENI